MNIATFIGLVAIALWGLSALLVTQLTQIPPFEIISISYTVACIILLGKLAINNEWSRIRQPIPVWLLGICGIFLTNLFYVFAMKLAPPESVVLITYTWPIITIIFTIFNPDDKFQWQFLGSGIVAYAGIALLIVFHPQELTLSSLLGYGLSFLSALSWATYCYFSRYFRQYSVQAIGVYCLFGLCVSLPLHLLLEETIHPSGKQWIILCFMGATISGPIFIFWEYGIKYGLHRFLFIASYLTPIISNSLLTLFGVAVASTHLILATVLVILGAALTLNLPTN